MIRLFILLLIVAAGMVAGPLLEGHQGYILIGLGDYTIEMSVVGAVIALILFYILVQLTIMLIKLLWRLGPGVHHQLRTRQRHQARQQMEEGILALYQEDFSSAHQQLSKSARRSETPSLNYLSAARAAALNGELHLSDQLLAKADKKSNNEQTQHAVWLAQARTKLENGEIEAARELLARLPQPHQRPSSLRLRYQIAKFDNDWDEQLATLKVLVKNNPDQWQRQLEATYRGKFNELAQQGDTAFDDFWQSLTRKEKQTSWLLRAAAPALVTLGQYDRLLKRLKKMLKTNDPVALSIVPRLPKDQAVTLIKQLEHLIKTYPSDSLCHEVLGAVYILNNQLEAASIQLKAGHAQTPSIRSCKLLGDIHAARHEHEQAAKWYQQALSYQRKEID